MLSHVGFSVTFSLELLAPVGGSQEHPVLNTVWHLLLDRRLPLCAALGFNDIHGSWTLVDVHTWP